MPLSLSGSLLITGSIVTPNSILGESITTFSPNLLSNGNFSGSAAGWTLGSDVFYLDNDISCSYTGGSPIASTTFYSNAGKSYKVSFTLSNVQNDTVYVYFNGNAAELTNIGSGTYEFWTNPSQNSYQETINFDLWNYNIGGTYTLDNVSVVEASLPGGLTLSSGSQKIIDVYTDNTSRINIGLDAGSGSYNPNQIFIGERAGLGLVYNDDNFIAIGRSAGETSFYSQDCVFVGDLAGYNASSSLSSVYIGKGAGRSAQYSDQSTFVGPLAGGLEGSGVIGCVKSVFLGSDSGRDASQAGYSNFIGSSAGKYSQSSSYSTFIGYNSGFAANGASGSFFVGSWTGYSTFANNSIFIGERAGVYQQNAKYSILLGYQAGYPYTGVSSAGQLGRNNIVIGTNVSLGDGRQDSINIAGLIFATGSYFSDSYLADGSGEPIAGQMFSGSANGRVGINQPLPQYSLDVSGSIGLSDVLVVATRATLPSLAPTGSIMASGSGAENKPYYWNGATWTSMI